MKTTFTIFIISIVLALPSKGQLVIEGPTLVCPGTGATGPTYTFTVKKPGLLNGAFTWGVKEPGSSQIQWIGFSPCDQSSFWKESSFTHEFTNVTGDAEIHVQFVDAASAALPFGCGTYIQQATLLIDVEVFNPGIPYDADGGDLSICPGETKTFSIPGVPDPPNSEANCFWHYKWDYTVPVGWSINGAGTTFRTAANSVQVTAPSNVVAGDEISKFLVESEDLWPHYVTNERNIHIELPNNLSISGTDLLCSSNSTFSVANVPSGTSVSWTVTPTSLFAVDNGSGASFSTRATNATSSGWGTVRAHLSGNCGSRTLEKTVWVGIPPTPTGNQFGEPISYNLSLDGVPDEICVSSASQSGSFYAGNVADDAGTFVNHWQTDAGLILTNPSPTGSSSVTVRLNNHGNNRYIRVRAQNACGYSAWVTRYFDLIYQPLGCSGGGGIGFAMQYAPNPVNESLSVTISPSSSPTTVTAKSETTRGKSESYIVTLRDEKGTLIFTEAGVNLSYSIPLQGQRSGYYYLTVEKEGVQQHAKIWKD
jgi:hypothetical protein